MVKWNGKSQKSIPINPVADEEPSRISTPIRINWYVRMRIPLRWFMLSAAIIMNWRFVLLMGINEFGVRKQRTANQMHGNWITMARSVYIFGWWWICCWKHHEIRSWSISMHMHSRMEMCHCFYVCAFESSCVNMAASIRYQVIQRKAIRKPEQSTPNWLDRSIRPYFLYNDVITPATKCLLLDPDN